MCNIVRVAVLAAAGISLAAAGCHKTSTEEPGNTSRSEHPSGEHPRRGEHPQGQPGEHPKAPASRPSETQGEHPKGEHPKGEHPK